MLLKKTLLAIICLSAFSFAQAQTEKKLAIKPLEIKNLVSDNIEFTISKGGDNIIVTAKKAILYNEIKLRTAGGKINGAEIVVRGGYGKTDKAVAPAVLNALVKLTDEKTGRLLKTTPLNTDGSFSFSDVPKGTYKLSIHDNPIATGWKIGGE